KDVEKNEAEPAPPGDDDDDSAKRPLGAPGPRTVECRVSAGPSVDCNRMPRGSATCMGQVLARRVCETVAPALGPAIAAEWLTCMLARADAGHECDTNRIFDCGLAAIGAACVDGTERATCGEIAKSCSDFVPELSASVCEHALGAWRPERRESLLSCFHHAC